ncbi:iron complex transport system ATP-binding protein [Actinocorallia herbida]|uniref:Iron complex transport system ATP-binding protein n=1 Tax=Actinocorallia herbida TaxID=58109 RepID=A0A3N1CSX5_9ACTN|nr:heme ABC transporter ATP-binding protein [Actinocorallia herbida]ROO84409.1 iron complex transport system ATP-binding protein [Actinocorallia herbida]
MSVATLLNAFRHPARLPGDRVSLTAEGVSVRRGGRPVLAGVDLEVRPGEVLALVGPNGAGKSTLLAALCGDLPYEGTVRVDGLPLADWRPVELAMRRAILTQTHAVSFSFAVEDIVRMGRAPWIGTPLEDEDDAAVAAALADADAARFAGRPFPRLSGGEQARVALARVLAQRTPVVLLDEPTAALDVRHQELVFAVTRELAERGRSIVAVVHDLGLAAAHADRVAVLSDGRLTACGPPAEVLTADLLTEVYGHPIEVVPHPRTGRPLVLPLR